ncbi:uncharacterized protein ACN427_011266 [Glossina fuscipes fuscipes]
MCDTASAEDIDEFIEYELRDCIEIEDDPDDEVFYQQQNCDENYEIVEELEEETEYDTNTVDSNVVTEIDVKPVCLEDTDFHTSGQLAMKSEFEEGFEEANEVHEIEFLPETGMLGEDSEFVLPDKSATVNGNGNKRVGLQIEKDNRITLQQQIKTEEKINKMIGEGPRRYMLFDELVACIVDYDPDGTPIVEFSISGSEADEKLPVECGICPDVMHRTKLAKHLKTHVVPGTNRYQCIYCEETYKDCKYLAGHARRHMGIRPYVCELCKLYFSTKQDLRVHNQRRHQEKEHICEVCGKTFAQNTQLKRHRESTHEKKRRFQCEHCPKSYYKNFSLQEHVRAVHMGKRRMIVCPFCGMQCRDAHKMARHRKQMHLHQSHYECHICHEEFTDINYFDAHKRSIQCRNNTRRKMEEEALLRKQQMEEEEEEETTVDGVSLDNSEVQHVQLISEDDIKEIFANSDHQDMLIDQKFIEIVPHEEGEDEDLGDELVYEITIDSNDN